MAYPLFSDSIPFYLLKRCQLLTSKDFSYGGFIMWPSLMFTLFKTREVMLNYAQFLKIGILALDQERTIFIVPEFEYAQ